MIIIEVMGGLGNQLQQYALYRKMKSLGKEAKLDLSWFSEEVQKKMASPRKLELAYFPGLPMEVCTREERERLLGRDDFWGKVKRRLPGQNRHFQESQMYHPEIFDFDDMYLSGYWACEKYYADILPELRRLIVFPGEERKNEMTVEGTQDKGCADAENRENRRTIYNDIINCKKIIEIYENETCGKNRNIYNSNKIKNENNSDNAEKINNIEIINNIKNINNKNNFEKQGNTFNMNNINYLLNVCCSNKTDISYKIDILKKIYYTGIVKYTDNIKNTLNTNNMNNKNYTCNLYNTYNEDNIYNIEYIKNKNKTNKINNTNNTENMNKTEWINKINNTNNANNKEFNDNNAHNSFNNEKNTDVDIKNELISEKTREAERERMFFELLNEITSEEMEAGESVSVHLRRGDYLDPGNAEMFGGICTDAYYDAAIRYVLKRHPDAHFYVFSDDREYARQFCERDMFQDVDCNEDGETGCAEDEEREEEKKRAEDGAGGAAGEREMLSFGRCTVVDWNTGENSIYDMKLMKCCKHNICANSTFSFWGARLNPASDKLMIRPAKHKNGQVIEPENMKELWKGWVLIDEAGRVVVG